MSQITFQAAFDPFHAVFRLFRIFDFTHSPIARDHIRILDFYLLFPFRIRQIRLAPKHQKYKRLADAYVHLTPYGEQPDGALLFQRMEPMQLAALETLASQSYLNPSALQSDLVQRTERSTPLEISARASELNAQQSDLIEFLSTLAKEYDLIGENGLKARSRLLDYRYDSI